MIEDLTGEGAVSILFEGPKYFGTTQTLFHIAVVEHAQQDIIEIVSYDKRHAVEAPRLYLIYSELLSRIDVSKVVERVQSLKEEARERQIPADEKKFAKIAIGEIMFEFLSGRLFAVALGGQKAKLEFKLLHKDPRSVSLPNPLCSKPEKVIPFSFDSVSASEGKGLSAKEKWRIPIVLAKVAKGRSLNRRDSKIWDACDTLFADGDMYALGSARFSTASMTNADTGSLGGICSSSKSQRWNAAQHQFAASSSSAASLPNQLKVRRRSSFTAGYEAILSSLQRGLSVVRGTSIKSSKVAVGTADRGGELTVGSFATHYTAGTVGSGESRGGWRQGEPPRGGTMMSRAASRKRIDGASSKTMVVTVTPAQSADNSGAVLDPEEEEDISHCERANRELRAARYMAKLAANAAAAAKTDSNFPPPTLQVPHQKPASIRVEYASDAAVETGQRYENAQSPSMKFGSSSGSAKGSMSALLHPVLRLIEAITRRSISAVAPSD